MTGHTDHRPQPTAGVTAVLDTTGACLTRLRPAAFTDLRAGRVGVSARPGMRRIGWLGSDILTELGCDATTTGAGRPGEANPDIVAAWLLAHRVRDLYVQFAWDLSYPALCAAADLARTAQVHLWLVGDSPFSDRHAEYLEPYHPRMWTGDEFLQHWAALTHSEEGPVPASTPPALPATSVARRAAGPSGVEATWPAHLPDDDFTTFRAACRDLLEPAAFHTVDEHYRAAHAEVVDTLVPLLLETRVGKAQAVDRESLEGTVAGWLAHRWEECESWQHFLVTVRAAQAAAFSSGWFLPVDLDQLLGAAHTTPRRAQRNTDTWRRLHALVEPHRGAVCALAAAGMGVDSIADLAVSSYDADTGLATDAAGRRFTIEEPARIFVETQQTLRRLRGAGAADPLIVPVDGRRPSPRTLAATVRQVRRELGVAVALPEPDRTTTDPLRWYRRWGVSVQELP